MSEMDIRKERALSLLMAELDGELGARERDELQRLLVEYPALRQEQHRLRRLKEVTETMAFKVPPEEVWKDYWTSVYSRVERGIGWILLSLGAIVILSYGIWTGVNELLADATIPGYLKAGILAAIVGVVVLLVSVLREKLFVGRRQRYKDVEI